MSKIIDLNKFQLEAYEIELPFERLKLGVDNVRFDVHISTEFRRVTEYFILELIIKYAEVSEHFIISPDINWFKETSEFQRLCTEVLTDAVNKAKSEQEVQIDFLAQTAVIKMLTETIQTQYDEAIQHCKNVIRKEEISQQMEATVRLREEVASIIQRKNQIVSDVGGELFDYFIEVQQEVNKLRASNFGDDAILPEELYSNPILRSSTETDGFFMIENYVLLGHRLEDPVNYNALFNLLSMFIDRLDKKQPPGYSQASKTTYNGKLRSSQSELKNYIPPQDPRIDGWIKQVDNMDKLFNCFHTQAMLKKLKARKADPQKIIKTKQTYNQQKTILNYFFKIIAAEKMIGGIVAAYLMQPMFRRYCPPLSPQECQQYLVVPKARKNTLRKLKRFKKYIGKSFPLSPLKRAVRSVNGTSRKSQKKCLVRFLKDFSRYHRDMRNFQLIRDALDVINISSDENVVNLSRENQTLYEFVLPHEDLSDQKPIINHVVLKADVRGSSAIIEQMKAKKLNPASNFSLNFFEPISKILSQYGAVKVFIEGDAIILSIYEHKDTPAKWYCVSRACGLAINILMIVRKYNKTNRKKGLPRMDLGIGIGFVNSPPTFFYDEDNQIMISPAINHADRLSRCDKTVRREFVKKKLPFNVYELQPSLDPETSVLFGQKTLRYNVKGIQISAKGFKKLRKEIHMKKVEFVHEEIQPEPLVLYSGKFPTIAGNYQRIIIREEIIPEVSLKDLSIIGKTEDKYYEVVTNQTVYQYAKGLL